MELQLVVQAILWPCIIFLVATVIYIEVIDEKYGLNNGGPFVVIANILRPISMIALLLCLGILLRYIPSNENWTRVFAFYGVGISIMIPINENHEVKMWPLAVFSFFAGLYMIYMLAMWVWPMLF